MTSCSSATKSVRVRVRVMIRARGRVALEGVSASVHALEASVERARSSAAVASRNGCTTSKSSFSDGAAFGSAPGWSNAKT
eukprot:scaffold128306_cov46-Phaeocystis_antarctica.AAC.3